MSNENENIKEKELNERLNSIYKAKKRIKAEIKEADGSKARLKQNILDDYEKEEEAIKRGYEAWIAYNEIKEEEILDLEEKVYPRKQITVKLYPETHKALKVKAASGYKSLERIVSSIVEDKILYLDIAKYVEEDFEKYDEFGEDLLLNGTTDIGGMYENTQYKDLYRRDSERNYYDEIFKENPRKRINVKVYQQTHRKLKIISALQDRSLNDIVTTIIEDEVGGNDIDFEVH